jgi:hypothetical protein
MKPETLFFLAAGLVFGAWHFGSLRWLSRQWIEGAGAPREGRLLAIHLLRLALLLAACWGVVRQGAAALLLFGLGLWLARQWWLRRARRGAGATEAA